MRFPRPFHHDRSILLLLLNIPFATRVGLCLWLWCRRFGPPGKKGAAEKSRHSEGTQRKKERRWIRNGVTWEPGGIPLCWLVTGGQGVCWASWCLEVFHRQSYQKTGFADGNGGRLQSLVLLCPSILLLADDGRLFAFFFPSNSQKRLKGELRRGIMSMLIIQRRNLFVWAQVYKKNKEIMFPLKPF